MVLVFAVVALSAALVHSETDLAFKRSSVVVEQQPQKLALHDTLDAKDKDDGTCWLYRFRGNVSYWENQGKHGEQFLEHNFGSDVFSAVLMGVSAIIMIFGFRLFNPVVFIFGLFGGAFVTFYLIDWILDSTSSMDVTVNCWVLGAGAVVGGILIGTILLKCLKLAMFCLGAGIGAVVGYYSWGIVFYRFEIHVGAIAGHNMTYWLCLLLPAIICGAILCRFEKHIVILATSICGAFAFTLGFDMMVLVRINSHFMLDSLSNFKENKDEELPYFIGVVVGAIVLTLVSMLVQFKLNKKHQSRQDRNLMHFGHRSAGIYADDMA